MSEPLARQAATGTYRERLYAPWWWYPVACFAAVLLGGEFIFVLPDSLVWLPVVLSLAGAIAVVRWISTAALEVTDGQLRAGSRRVPVDRIADMFALDYNQVRRLAGRQGDPSAFAFVRSWIGPGVQLVLRPTGDLTDDRIEEPYWLLSTRRPDQLLAALAASG